MGGVLILRSFLLAVLLLSAVCTDCLQLPQIVGATRLSSTRGHPASAVVTMPNDLISRLRCSPTIGKLSTQDKEWFNQKSRPSPAPVNKKVGAKRVKPRHASLCVVLRERDEGTVEMLVIKRATNPKDKWSGHMALPGGRQEPGETELQVAVRECREEVGVSLDSSRFALLGRLKDSKTGARKLGLTVASFVFFQTDKLDVPVVTQEAEVAAAWWVDTALFYPAPVPEVIGYPASTSVKFLGMPPFKALLQLFRVDMLYFRCCHLPPPPLFQARAGPGDDPLPSTRTNGLPDAPIPMDDSPEAQGFVLWGLTFGVVSHMIVAAGGPSLVYKDLPTFRFRNPGANFLFRMFHKLTGLGTALIKSLASSVPVLRLRQ